MQKFCQVDRAILLDLKCGSRVWIHGIGIERYTNIVVTDRMPYVWPELGGRPSLQRLGDNHATTYHKRYLGMWSFRTPLKAPSSQPPREPVCITFEWEIKHSSCHSQKDILFDPPFSAQVEPIIKQPRLVQIFSLASLRRFAKTGQWQFDHYKVKGYLWFRSY